MAEESNDASIYIYIYPLPRGQYRFGEGGGTDAYYARPKDAAQ